jgi:hypothetical protein
LLKPYLIVTQFSIAKTGRWKIRYEVDSGVSMSVGWIKKDGDGLPRKKIKKFLREAFG